jgi:hypothetical protein
MDSKAFCGLAKGWRISCTNTRDAFEEREDCGLRRL